MFTPVSMRSANSYRTVGVETSVGGASPHELVRLLYEGLLESLHVAKGAILKRDMEAKGRAISRAARIIEEGLKAGLDVERGGELAVNLRDLYNYCSLRVTEANLKSDVAMLDEVIALIQPVADSWNQIRPEAGRLNPQ